ncbi:MAG: FAD-dependent oxidoreductase [Woeseia sp.]
MSFGLLSQQLRRPAVARLLLRNLWKQKVDGLIDYFGAALCSCRSWLDSSIQDPAARACLAAWVLNVGLTPESSLSGHFAKIVAFTLEQTGMPVVRGGNQVLLDAFAKIIEAHDGTIMTSADVDGILASRNRATGVTFTDGSLLKARNGVICSVTPTQLYGRLLREVEVPAAVRTQQSDSGMDWETCKSIWP